MTDEEKFMAQAIALSAKAIESGEGGPFGCIVVKNKKIIGEGYNKVISTNDPTAHAEMVAIRNACNNIQSYQLDGCEIYTSCEPCPMCLGAIYWARPSLIYYANTREDAASIGFDDAMIYEELERRPADRKIKSINISRDNAYNIFEQWMSANKKMNY